MDGEAAHTSKDPHPRTVKFHLYLWRRFNAVVSGRRSSSGVEGAHGSTVAEPASSGMGSSSVGSRRTRMRLKCSNPA